MDYSEVTEAVGNRITREALSMLYTRYWMAASVGQGKDVLEVACGSGQGLGYLAGKANRVVGGDYTEKLLRTAQRHYRGRIPLVRLDAHELPFKEGTFDLVILYEAVYYLKRPEQFLAECNRVLRHQGIVLLCTANIEWENFSPSPLSTKHLGARELVELFNGKSFSIELYAAFPTIQDSWGNQLRAVVKQVAFRLRLIPRKMKSKELLKRIFYGQLEAVPAEIKDGNEELSPISPIPLGASTSEFQVLYVVGQRQGKQMPK